MATVAAIVLVLAMVPFFCVFVEHSKELRVRDGFIMDWAGHPVATAEYMSFGALFDLPSFDITTLAAVKQINLHLSSTKEAVFTVTGVVKHSACQAVTFYLQDGGEVLLDGRAIAAVATIRGKRYTLGSQGRRVSASAAPPAGSPRLYVASEFFGGSEGSGSRPRRRRLAENVDAGGWASLGIVAAEAVLDDCSLDVVPHETVSVSGKVSIGESSVDMHAFYNSSDPRDSAVRVAHPDGRSVLADYAVGFEFHFDSEGELTECEPMQAALPPKDELESLETKAVAGGKVIVTGVDGGGVDFLVQVDDFALDHRSQPLRRPSVEECLVLEERGRAGNRSLAFPGRQLVGSCGEWYSMARAAYDDPPRHYSDAVASAGWAEVGRCDVANGHARVWTRGGQLAVGFGGSNDLQDWLDNLDVQESGGLHSGFVQYVEQLRPCVEQVISRHGGLAHFYVGHSLGGAAATVFYGISSTNAPDTRVITYGAPKTHSSAGCVIPGTRYAHASDPAASNFWGIMGGYHHKVADAVFYQDAAAHRRREGWSWRRRRDWRWDFDLPSGCAQETEAGCLVDTLYHFAITHRRYDSHGEQNC